MKDVLERIRPGREEQQRVQKTVKEFLTRLNKVVQGATAILGGSGAKGTWLSGNYDIDIFVKYKDREKTHQLSELLEASLRKAFPKEALHRLHGSRDYFQLCYNGVNIEVVPIISIRNAEEALNITDVSPLHAQWITKKAKMLKDEILLAKQFFKANRLYGAESHIGGFSGYVLEILIVHYGSFQKLLQEAVTWKGKAIIDVEGHYKGKNVLFELNTSKTQSPLIVIDPVDKGRNAAAAVSREKFLLLKKTAKAYLAKPTAGFFTRKELDIKTLQKKGHLVLLDVAPLKGKEDVVGVKILKVLEYLTRKLEPFDVKQSGWDEEKLMYFVLAKDKVSPLEVRTGPRLEMKEHVQMFKKAHKKTFIRENRIFAEIPVKTPLLRPFVEDLLKDKYIRDRVKAMSLRRL